MMDKESAALLRSEKAVVRRGRRSMPDKRAVNQNSISQSLDLTTLLKSQPLLTVEDVARRLRVEVRTVYAMVSQKRIPFRKPPGTNLLRFDPEEYLEWEKGNSSK
jgi:excisionase family DNA binding protein